VTTSARGASNAELAALALDIARQAATDRGFRRAALCLHVALLEAKTVRGARKVLALLDDLGHADLHTTASTILDLLTRKTSP
jgi:hypothetical protein